MDAFHIMLVLIVVFNTTILVLNYQKLISILSLLHKTCSYANMMLDAQISLGKKLTSIDKELGK